jgi:hypothetical protein
VKSPAELLARIDELEIENRVLREAAISAAGVTERALVQLQRAGKVVKAAIAWDYETTTPSRHRLVSPYQLHCAVDEYKAAEPT